MAIRRVRELFGPHRPEGRDGNWIQTLPDRGWFPIFRAYGALEPYFDKTWKLPDVQPVPARLRT